MLRCFVIAIGLWANAAPSAYDPFGEIRAAITGDARGVIDRLRSASQDPAVKADTLLLARTLEMLGEQYYRLSDIDEAKRHWDRALELRRSKFGERSAEYGVALGWQARYHNYMAAPQWDHQVTAETISEQAVELLKSDGKVRPLERVVVLRERAYSYKVFHSIHSPYRYADSPSDASGASRPLFRKALRVAQQARDTIWAAQILHDIGNTFTDIAIRTRLGGDVDSLRSVVDSASWYYQRSMEWMTDAGLAASEPVMMDHLCLGLLHRYAYDDLGKPRAIDHFEKALLVFQEMHGTVDRTDPYHFNPEITNKAQMLELMSFIMHDHETLWLADKASGHLDSALLVLNAAIPYWEAMLKEYDSERLHLVTTSYSHSPFHYALLAYSDRYMHERNKDDLYATIVSLERRRNARMERDRLLKDLPPNEWMEPGALQKIKAPAGSLILVYFNAHNCYVIVIDENGPEMLELGTIEMNSEFGVGVFNELHVFDLKKDRAAYDRAAHEWYSKLLSKALAGRKGRELVIVPYGTMAHLPFEALVVDTTRTTMDRYVANRYEIRYAPDLSTALKKISVHEPEVSVALAETDGKSSLPFAERTAQWLADRVNDHVHRNAGHTDLDSLFSMDGILHIASHARLEQRPDGEAYILVSDGRWSPQIGNTDRIRRDLVVLAACSSGSGRVFHGEGAKTIGHAVLEAGVACVVHTLWPVDDQATNEILQLMYDRMFDGSSPSKALQEAKKEFIHRHKDDGLSDPFYWSGIVVLGADVDIEWPRSKLFPIATGVFLLLTAVAVVYNSARRRKARSRT